MKIILQTVLGILAKAIIWRHKPLIIGVTGSVGKTSTREAIFTVLKSKYNVRQPEKNYNNEIGLPLTILGSPHYRYNVFGWLWVVIKSITALILYDKNYPSVLILEYGVDRAGDIDYLLAIARPTIAVVTAMGEIPMHVAYFENPEDVAREKIKLIKALPEDGYALLNHDDRVVYGMKDETKAKVITYGFNEHAELRALHYELRTTLEDQWGEVPDGISFKVDYQNRIIPIRLSHVFGKTSVYAALAALGVGTMTKMNLVEIADALSCWESPPGRLKLLKGAKHSFILDDTYNAGPDSTQSALEVLEALPGKRKIAVLGDMLELGRFTETAHRAIGDKAAQCVDILITVGAKARFIADQAMVWDLLKEQVLRFDDIETAGHDLYPILKEGDVVLVKGSQGMRMEKIVREIIADPDQAGTLLVRQEGYWQKNRS